MITCANSGGAPTHTVTCVTAQGGAAGGEPATVDHGGNTTGCGAGDGCGAAAGTDAGTAGAGYADVSVTTGDAARMSAAATTTSAGAFAPATRGTTTATTTTTAGTAATTLATLLPSLQ